MLTGKLRNQVDKIWEAFWTGGITNPISVIEQFSYLLFIRRLDETHTRFEKFANLAGKPIDKPIFKRHQQSFRWSKFKNKDPQQMFELVRDKVFPFIKTMHGEESTFAQHMRDAIFMIPKPSLLDQVVQLIDRAKRDAVYTSFRDELGQLEGKDVANIMGAGGGLEQYRRKVEAYIRAHEDNLTIQRIKRNRPITALDLEQLDEMLFRASGMDAREAYDSSIHPDKPLGVFIRELVGLDRRAAKEAFADFLDETRMNSTQIQFVNTLVDYFTQNGVMEETQLAKPPFSEIHSNTIFGLFDDDQVTSLRQKIQWINGNAEAANNEVTEKRAAEDKYPY